MSQRPDEWDGDGLESESESDDDDDPDRADPVGLGRVLEQLLDVTATCVPVDMEQALRDVQVVAKRLVDLGDVGKYVVGNVVGTNVGLVLGNNVGPSVGAPVGWKVGKGVGNAVGSKVTHAPRQRPHETRQCSTTSNRSSSA